MHAGRKILNLRCDRKITQQDLARACDITPSALSKIEAGVNSPRAHIIWRIAQTLGVTVKFLLDEDNPYPHLPCRYRDALRTHDVDPAAVTRKEVTREESLFLESLRRSPPVAREVAFAIPGAPIEALRLLHFVIAHTRARDPGATFKDYFESLMTGRPPAAPRGKAEQPARKTKGGKSAGVRGSRKPRSKAAAGRRRKGT